MKKDILNKFKKSVLFYTIVYTSIFVIINLILNIFDMNYREWIYIVSLFLIGGGFVIGIIQLLCKIKRKVLRIISVVLFIIVLIPISLYTYVFCVFAYQPEHIVVKDGNKMVAYVTGFMDTYVEYYDYKNFFFVGNKLKIKEFYGSGGFDPIENKYGHDYSVVCIDYYDEDGKVIHTENNTNNNVKNNVDNQPQDVTQKILNSEFYSSGIINNIDENNIYFFNSNLKQYYINKNIFKYINGRTNDAINIEDIKVGYYIEPYTYGKSEVISILSNIKGEELKKELIKNFTLENPIYLTVSPIGTNIEIINKNKAILSITFDDLLADYNTDGGKFEMKIEINSNTVIECKGGISKIEQLEDVSLDIIKIKLDKNTINDKIPMATYFMSSNGN